MSNIKNPFDKAVLSNQWKLLQGELASVLTEFDREIDEASVHKGKQM